MESAKKKPSFGLAAAVLVGIIAIMFVGIMLLKTISVPACLILVVVMICTVSKLCLGYSFDELMGFMGENIKDSAVGLWFFVAIGAIIASWMISGTVPAIIYYGLKIISPKVFLTAGFLLCSLTALCTGTSWGTVGTIGIALVGIGQGMGIPLPITAAAIVSGAAFGDKMPPVSDTPNLAAISAGSSVYPSLKAMIITMVPAYIIALVLFSITGIKYGSSSMNYEIVKETQTTLAENFNLNPIVLLPVLVLLVLSVKKFPALPSMAIAVTTSIIVAVIFQGASLATCFESLNSGFSIETGSKYVDPILNRGGLQNVMGTFLIAFLAISMGGVLEKCGYLSALIKGLLKRVKSTSMLVLTVMITSILSTAAFSEAYISYILNGALYKDEFDARGLDRSMLARIISEGGLMLAPLMPWTTFGAFCMATLGISGLKYAPYAYLNYLSPIVSVILTFVGIGIIRAKNDEK